MIDEIKIPDTLFPEAGDFWSWEEVQAVLHWMREEALTIIGRSCTGCVDLKSGMRLYEAVRKIGT